MPKIPFQLLSLNEGGYHLLLSVEINEVKTYAVVDTGASRTVLDFNQINDMKIKILEKEIVSNSIGVGGEISNLQIGQLKKLKIQKFELKKLNIILIDLLKVTESYVSAGLPKISMILGNDILVNHQAEINYRQQFIKFKTKSVNLF